MSGTRTINANTVLLTIILGLSAWTLKEVVAIGKEQAVLSFRVEALELRGKTVGAAVSRVRPPG